jgi:hypothetical protein
VIPEVSGEPDEMFQIIVSAHSNAIMLRNRQCTHYGILVILLVACCLVQLVSCPYFLLII